MKWYRNKDMLKSILEDNKKELQKHNSAKVEALLMDETNLIQDHLKLMEENEELKEKYKRRAETSKDLNEALKKYKNAIEILKKYLDINIVPNKYGNYLIEATAIELITQQEYDLLKEVLGNE